MADNGPEIARAYVLVIPSLRGAQKSITDELVPGTEAAGKEAGEKGGAHLRAGIEKAARLAAAATAAALAGAVAMIRQSLDAYAETQQLAGGIQKLFGEEAGAQVIEAAAQAYKTAGMSANDYLKQVTGISAAMLKSGITAEEAATKADEAMRQIADNANTFGRLSAEELGNVYSALARGSYQVLDQLSLGYGGTRAGLTQLIKDANAWAKANGRAADLSIDSFADVVTAIGYIQEKLEIAGTTAEEAEGTISGSLGMLKGAWANLIAGFGDPGADIDSLVDHVLASLRTASNNILPTVTRIANAIIKALPDVVTQIAGYIPEVFPAVLEATVTLATELAHQLPGILESIIGVITDNTEMFVGAAIDIALALVQAAPRIIEALVPLIPKVITDTVDALTAPDNQESFVLGAIAIATAVVEAAPRIIEELAKGVPKIIDNITTAFTSEESQQAFISAGTALAQALWNGLRGSLSFLLPSYLRNALDGIDALNSVKSRYSYSGATLDLGGYDWLATQTGSISIGNMSINANNGDTAASVFASIRQAAAMGGA